MATPVEVPKVGNTMEECIVSRWLRRKGDSVSAGDVIAEIETDKTTVEISAPVAGTILETDFEEGAIAPVFQRLCLIGDPSEANTAPASPAPAAPPFQAAIHPSTPETGLPGTQAMPAFEPASSLGPRTLPVSESKPASLVAGNGSAPIFSPRARRFAQDHNFHPASVVGSGPGRRVLVADLERLYAAATAAGSVGAGHVRPVAPSTPPAPAPPGTGERMSTIRERIARRMRESLATTAQYTMHSWADAGGLLALRGKIKASPAAPQVTINDMVLFAVARALVEMPALNAELIDGRLHRHESIHLGFACDTDRGLMVPVIRDCQKLSLAELARRSAELAQRAMAGTIGPDDLAGATFTVSNLGSLGIESFTPILNPPQVAILGVDAIQPRLARRENKIEIIDSIGLSLTCDHQVIDGAPGARFLKLLKEQIERVESTSQIGPSN
jgi:pyruvate dehydrogenase E2 component (dihydrolipoamide acetyltransferase)